MQPLTLIVGIIWIAVGLRVGWGRFLLVVRRRRAEHGTGRAQGTVVKVIQHDRRTFGFWLDFRPVIEFVTSTGERVQFEDLTRVGEYAEGRAFEVAAFMIAVYFIGGIVFIVQGITGK